MSGAAVPLTLSSWSDYQHAAAAADARFAGRYRLCHFEYVHPPRLQPGTPRRLRRRYPVRLAYLHWGEPGQPLLVCCGGVVNSAMRFAYLADALRARYQVVCLDWAGRGRSGWLREESDYGAGSHLEQLRQLLAHLGPGPVDLLGSSLGGSVGIELAARWPARVRRLILNDIGPFVPRRRRMRRAQALARHYVFRNPAELLRRIGAAQRNFGPVDERVRFHLSHHQTRWSEADGGRVYRHDLRAMQAYRREAAQDLDQWALWCEVRCPVLLIHGLQSDALLAPTLRRMACGRALDVMHVPDTGHTPVLSDRHQIGFIADWLAAPTPDGIQWCVLHAPARAV